VTQAVIDRVQATFEVTARRPIGVNGCPMSGPSAPIHILIAEDDPDDRLLAQEALAESNFVAVLDFVADGYELLQFLHRQGAYAARAGAPLPGIILLDLNMPRMDGREALQKLKADPVLKSIPVVIMTNSRDDEDISYTYQLGASSYVLKPRGFDELVKLMDELCRYWFRLVELPPAVFP
jgi:CheY-like chemotaxis protein